MSNLSQQDPVFFLVAMMGHRSKMSHNAIKDFRFETGKRVGENVPLYLGVPNPKIGPVTHDTNP